MGKGKGKGNNYIDGKELRLELHSFARSYRLEQKDIFRDMTCNPEFKKMCERKNIDASIFEHVTLSKEEEASIGLVTKLQRKKKTKEDKLKMFMKKYKFTYERKVKFLKRHYYNRKAYKVTNGTISDVLGEMFLLLAENLASKKNWIGYTYKEEMIGRGILYLCKYAHNFQNSNPKANAFAYITQICKNGFLQAKQTEEKQSDMKDKLIKNSMEESELERWCKNE